GEEVGGDLWREGLFAGDVGDGEAAAGFEDTVDFAEDGRLVGDEVDHAVADDAVHAARGQGQLVDRGEMELDVGEALLGGVVAGTLDHLGGHVDADGLAGG